MRTDDSMNNMKNNNPNQNKETLHPDDEAPRSSRRANVGLLASPEVVAATEGALRRYHLRGDALRDAVAEVQTLTLEHVRRSGPPRDVGGWKALCVTIAQNWRQKQAARERTRARYEADSVEAEEQGPLAHPVLSRDPIDTRRMLEVLAGLFRDGQMPEHGVDILDCVQAGVPYDEIAEELGISADAVRGRLRRMRRTFLAKLVELGMAKPCRTKVKRGAAGNRGDPA